MPLRHILVFISSYQIRTKRDDVFGIISIKASNTYCKNTVHTPSAFETYTRIDEARLNVNNLSINTSRMNVNKNVRNFPVNS